jgi:hypothetical protein
MKMYAALAMTLLTASIYGMDQKNVPIAQLTFGNNEEVVEKNTPKVEWGSDEVVLQEEIISDDSGTGNSILGFENNPDSFYVPEEKKTPTESLGFGIIKD